MGIATDWQAQKNELKNDPIAVAQASNHGHTTPEKEATKTD